MRASLTAALFAMLVVLGAGQATLAQAPAFAKAQGLSAEQAEAAMKKVVRASAAMQPGDGVQQAYLLASPDEMSQGVQVVDFPAVWGNYAGYQGGGYQNGACANGYCPGGYSGFAGNCPPSYGHHGFNGGHYGYFGGAHRTPGYPHHHLHREYVGPQGPPTAQVAYPYYTVRGPRDFLLDNPPSIGR